MFATRLLPYTALLCRSPYRDDSDSLHDIARRLEAEGCPERRQLGAELRRAADKVCAMAKADERA